MFRIALLICTLLCLGMVCGCAQRPSQIVDLDQYVFEQTLDQCYNQVRNMASDAPELVRSTYFDQCMERNGYGPETYKDRWINI